MRRGVFDGSLRQLFLLNGGRDLSRLLRFKECGLDEQSVFDSSLSQLRSLEAVSHFPKPMPHPDCSLQFPHSYNPLQLVCFPEYIQGDAIS
jgi:hypothetical protein